MLGLDPTPASTSVEAGKETPPAPTLRPLKRFFMATERIMVPVLSITVSILVPQFSSLMAFLGSFSAFVICVIGPISAKIAMTGRCHRFDAAILAVSTVMAVWGTISAFRTA